MVNIIVRLLDGSSKVIECDQSSSVSHLKSMIEHHTMIPASCQSLMIGSTLADDRSSLLSFQHRNDQSTLLSFESSQDPDSTMFVTLLLSLLGGKGGFGTLLRTSAHADMAADRGDMRDLQGRRLRDVEQMKELEQWKRKNAHLSDAEKKQREREYREKLAEIERTGGRERKHCKYGVECRYQTTTCSLFHPDDDEKSTSHKRARTSRDEVKSRVDSDSDKDDGDDDIFAVHAADEEKAQALIVQSKPVQNVVAPSTRRAFDDDDLLGFDSEDESSSSISTGSSALQPESIATSCSSDESNSSNNESSADSR